MGRRRASGRRQGVTAPGGHPCVCGADGKGQSCNARKTASQTGNGHLVIPWKESYHACWSHLLSSERQRPFIRMKRGTACHGSDGTKVQRVTTTERSMDRCDGERLHTRRNGFRRHMSEMHFRASPAFLALDTVETPVELKSPGPIGNLCADALAMLAALAATAPARRLVHSNCASPCLRTSSPDGVRARLSAA